MVLINWNNSLSVDVEEIDQQHKRLIAIINDLNSAMKQGKGKDIIGGIVRGLIDYAVVHFKTEENYFEQFGYSETDDHIAEHVSFIQKVSEFKDGYEKGTLGLTIQVMQFLSDWLQNHIKGTDKKYSQFFNNNGLR
jgi:hemerythrin